MHKVWDKIAEWIEKDYDEAEARKKASTLNIVWFVVGVVIIFALAIYATCAQEGGIPY